MSSCSIVENPVAEKAKACGYQRRSSIGWFPLHASVKDALAKAAAEARLKSNQRVNGLKHKIKHADQNVTTAIREKMIAPLIALVKTVKGAALVFCASNSGW